MFLFGKKITFTHFLLAFLSVLIATEVFFLAPEETEEVNTDLKGSLRSNKTVKDDSVILERRASFRDAKGKIFSFSEENHKWMSGLAPQDRDVLINYLSTITPVKQKEVMLAFQKLDPLQTQKKLAYVREGRCLEFAKCE